MNYQIMEHICFLMPEIILFSGAILALLISLWDKASVSTIVNFSMLVLAVTLYYMVGNYPVESHELFGKMILVSRLTQIVKIITLICSLLVMLYMLGWSRSNHKYFKKEFIILFLLSLVGGFIAISAYDLLTLFLGLELQSLSFYIIASFNRNEPKSSEAGLKYFTLGALTTGVFLFGASLMYGYAGSINYETIKNLYLDNGGMVLNSPMIVRFAVIMIFSAVLFKLAAFPFHSWAPDVYEGSPMPAALIFSSVSKMVATGVFLNIFYNCLSGFFNGAITEYAYAVIVATLAIGAFGAIIQTSLKRLIAYSSIFNIGFVLIVMVVSKVNAIAAALSYMVIYVISVIGLFALISLVGGNKREDLRLRDLNGLSYNHKTLAIAISILMFSFVGVPPMAGFYAKFLMLKAAINSDQYILAAFAIILSVVAAFYYLRIVKYMYFELPESYVDHREKKYSLEMVLVASFAVTFVLLFSLYSDSIVKVLSNLS